MNNYKQVFRDLRTFGTYLPVSDATYDFKCSAISSLSNEELLDAIRTTRACYTYDKHPRFMFHPADYYLLEEMAQQRKFEEPIENPEGKLLFWPR